MNVGDGTFDVELADGRVSTLHQVNGDVVPVKSSLYANLPTAGVKTGTLRRVTDAIPGLYIYTGTLWSSVSGVAMMSDLGLKGDNSEDNSGILATALQDIPTGACIYFQPGEYRFDSEFSLTSGDGFASALANKEITLKGAGWDKTKFIVAAGGGTTRPWRIGGNVVSTDWPYSDPLVRFAELAVQGDIGDHSLTTTLPVTVSAGQWLLIVSDEAPLSSGGNRFFTTSEKVQVAASVSGSTTISLSRPLRQTHTLTDTGIFRQDPAIVHIEDIGFYCESPAPYPLRFDRVVNSTFTRIALVGFGAGSHAGFANDCQDVVMRDVMAWDVDNQWDIAKNAAYVTVLGYTGNTSRTDRNSNLLVEEAAIKTRLRDITINGRITLGNNTYDADLSHFDVRRLDLAGFFGRVAHGTVSETIFVSSVASGQLGTHAQISDIQADLLDVDPSTVFALRVNNSRFREVNLPRLSRVQWINNIIDEPENSTIGV